jgi:hypothetical protein
VATRTIVASATSGAMNQGINEMPPAPKQQDKPNDPPYSGGEDETTQNRKSKPGDNEPPVDESDEGPSAG